MAPRFVDCPPVSDLIDGRTIFERSKPHFQKLDGQKHVQKRLVKPPLLRSISFANIDTEEEKILTGFSDKPQRENSYIEKL